MILRFLGRLEEIAISLLLVAMTLLVFMDVVLRFGFGTAFLWSQELALNLSAWLVLFGASYGLKVGAHISVDALVRLLPPRGQRLLSGVAIMLALCYCALFLYGSWVYLAKMKHVGIELEDLPVPLWQAQSILVIGLAMLALRLLELLWKVATGRAAGFRHADEARASMRVVEELAEERTLGEDHERASRERPP